MPINKQKDPLLALMKMRRAISNALYATEGYGYEEWNARMKALQAEAFALFTEFDRIYSTPDPE